MTTAEMQIEVKVGLDKADSLQYPDLSPELVDVFLNRSQDIIVEQFNRGRAFYELQEILLRGVMVVAKYTSNNNIYGSGAYYTTTLTTQLTDYLYHVMSEVAITRTNFPVIVTKQYRPTTLIEDIDSIHYRVDNYNKPIFESPKMFLQSSSFYLLADAYTTISTTDNMIIHYIRKPVRIVSSGTLVNCELNNRLHRKVVDLCINLMLESIESPRLDTNTQQLAQKL